MNLFDYHKKYQEEVLKHFLPIGRTNGKSTRAANAETIPMRLELSASHRYYRQSKFHYPSPNTLGHYTKFHHTKSILKEGVIRLYDLTKLNDESEFSFAAEKLQLSHSLIQQAKQDIFIISLVNADNEEEREELWDSYGDNGRGCLLLFNIDFPEDAFYFHLSKVYYEDCSIIEDFINATREFEKNNPVQIRIDLSRLLPFFKSEGWQSENEVRLMANFKSELANGLYDYRIRQDESKGNNYICAAIKTERQNPTDPEIKLTKLIIGPNVLNPEIEQEELKELCTQCIGYLPEISVSALQGVRYT